MSPPAVAAAEAHTQWPGGRVNAPAKRALGDVQFAAVVGHPVDQQETASHGQQWDTPEPQTPEEWPFSSEPLSHHPPPPRKQIHNMPGADTPRHARKGIAYASSTVAAVRAEQPRQGNKKTKDPLPSRHKCRRWPAQLFSIKEGAAPFTGAPRCARRAGQTTPSRPCNRRSHHSRRHYHCNRSSDSNICRYHQHLRLAAPGLAARREPPSATTCRHPVHKTKSSSVLHRPS